MTTYKSILAILISPTDFKVVPIIGVIFNSIITQYFQNLL